MSDQATANRPPAMTASPADILRALMEATPLAIVAMDLEGRVTLWNNGAERIFGWSAAETIGQPLPIVPPELRAESRQLRERSQQGEAVSTRELLRRHKDGSPVYVSLSNAPLRDATGRICGVVGVLADITQQKQLLQALRESEELFRSLSASSPLGIFLHDATGQCIYANPQCRALLGVSLMESLGDGWLKRVHPLDRSHVAAAWHEGIAQRQPQQITFRLKPPDGAITWVSLRSAPMFDETGAWRGHVATLENITEHKQAEQNLRETNQRLEVVLAELKAAQAQVVQQERLSALGTMASGIAHDFNNALASILGFSELLLHRPEMLRDQEKALRYLKLINTAAQDAGQVVNRLREFYRTRDEGEVLAALDLNDLVRQAVSLTKPRWQAQAQAVGRTIRVPTNLAEIPPVAGNAAELREALANLIINAVDALPHGGQITLTTRAEDQHVVLDVSDTGVGMTEDVQRRCFEPFFSTKGQRGTGLGLSMVYGIIQRHGGEISVESTLGQGTTFHLRFPIATGPAAPVTAQPAAAASQPLRVLLIDDDSSVRDILHELLVAEGHAVVSAPDGRTGLSVFDQQPFDVVIVDRAMPGLSGDQVAEAIKASQPSLPVILLTGFGGLMQSAGEKPAGVDFVLGKPVTMAELRAALTRAVGHAK